MSLTSQTKSEKQTTEPKQQIKEPNDVYSVLEKSLDRYFKEVKENAASYFQAVSDLQQEIITMRKKNIGMISDVQKNLSEKAGVTSNLPENLSELANVITEHNIKAWQLQNGLVLASLEALSRNIQAFNNNAKMFADVNSKLVDSWIPIFKQKNNE